MNSKPTLALDGHVYVVRCGALETAMMTRKKENSIFFKVASVVLVSLMTLGMCMCKSRSEPNPAMSPTMVETTRPREATHAGSWYPKQAPILKQRLETMLTQVALPSQIQTVLALVSPHAGLDYSGSIAAQAFATLKEQAVHRVFLLGPSHRRGFEGIALPSSTCSGYATPLGELRIDHEAVEQLRGQPGFNGPSGVHDAEHSLEMEAIFLTAVKPEATLVPLVVGRVPDARFAKQLASSIRFLLTTNDVVVVSSDFTHYGPQFGFTPFAGDEQVLEKLDGLMNQAFEILAGRNLEAFDSYLEKTEDTICGKEPLRVLLSLLPADARALKLAQDTSGRMTNDVHHSVSYLAVAYHNASGWGQTSMNNDTETKQNGNVLVLDSQGQELALRMVRDTLEAYLGERKTLDDASLQVPESGPFREEYSVFVTLKKHGMLRGCIGHILPIQALWRDIRDNAISAAVHDSRFSPVSHDELSQIDVEISILTHPEPIPSVEAFVVGKHGVILEAFGRSAVFLPQVAPEQGWDRATTLMHLSRKAGLPQDAWKDKETSFKVFEAQVF